MLYCRRIFRVACSIAVYVFCWDRSLTRHKNYNRSGRDAVETINRRQNGHTPTTINRIDGMTKAERREYLQRVLKTKVRENKPTMGVKLSEKVPGGFFLINRVPSIAPQLSVSEI